MARANGANTLLASTTSATQSRAFQLLQSSEGQQATLQCNGLTGTNKAYLQYLSVITGSYVNVKMNGTDVYFDINNNTMFVSGNNKYRIDKQGSDDVGVAIISDKEYYIY